MTKELDLSSVTKPPPCFKASLQKHKIMAEKADAPSITCLPPEILTLIASRVEQSQSAEADVFAEGLGASSLKSFIEVCKDWCSISRGTAKRLVIKCDWPVSDVVLHAKKVLRLYPKADSLCFCTHDRGSFLSLKRMAGSLPALCEVKHLKFVCNAGSSNSLHLPRSISSWQNLESFSLSGYRNFSSASLPQGFESSTHLRRLDLNDYTLKRSEAMPSLFGKWDNLQYLSLGTYLGVTLPKEVERWKALKQLSMMTPYLETLPEEVGAWRNLQRIFLKRCIRLTSLPDSAGDWECLEEAEISNSRLSGLPEQVGAWKKLNSLDLSDSELLIMLPAATAGWEKLRWASFRGCSKLRNLSEIGRGWNSLEEIERGRIEGLGLPEGVGQWSKLKRIKLSWCKSGGQWFHQRGAETCCGLQTLPEAVENWRLLEIIDLSGCRTFRCLPRGVGSWENVREVTLGSLQDLPAAAGRWLKLQSLKIESYKPETLPEGVVGEWKELTSLHLSGAKLRELPNSVCAWERLEEIQVACPLLERLAEGVRGWKNLKEVYIGDCKLVSLPEGVSEWQSLEKIRLACPLLECLPEAVSGWRRMSEANFEGCDSLKSLSEGVSGWGSLQVLMLNGCTRLATLPQSVSSWKMVRYVDLTGCEALTALPDGLGEWAEIRSLKLGYCTGLDGLPESLTNWPLEDRPHMVSGLTRRRVWTTRDWATTEALVNQKLLDALENLKIARRRSRG
jgi:Leucine-rich repeat (LRR) protein